MNAIETFNLNFSYQKNHVIKDMSIQIPKGAIFGLIGRNGHGKSTLIKLLLGQLPSKKGDIAYFGNTDFDHKIFNNIGCMIESPALYDFMTVEEHLKMLDLLFQKGSEWIDKVIQTVGLQDEKNKVSRKLSTGQKQRLGIAMAIFRDPQILILDEPVNGLDSIGMIDIRNLLLELNKQGKTILISSHIISELEKLCTHVGVIDHGTLVFQDKVDELTRGNLEEFYLNTINQTR